MKLKLTALAYNSHISIWSIIGFVIGAVGFGLGLTINPWFLILGAVSCCLLPLMRLLGIIQDQDEFQKNSIKTAALVSYIVTGLFLFAILITGKSGVKDWGAHAINMNLLSVLLMSFYLTYFFQFWDGLKAGRIISYILILFWGLFTILNVTVKSKEFLGFIMQFSGLCK